MLTSYSETSVSYLLKNGFSSSVGESHVSLRSKPMKITVILYEQGVICLENLQILNDCRKVSVTIYL